MSTPESSVLISHDHLSAFSSDVQSLWATHIPILNDVPSPLSFIRDYVALSRPFIVRNAFPVLSLEKLKFHLSKDPELRLNVDVTPDGIGDCIRVLSNGEKIFVLPETRPVPCTDFVNGLRLQQMQPNYSDQVNDQNIIYDDNNLPILSDSYLQSRKDIMYYSRQNDCLRRELPSLTSIFPKSIPFADEAFDAEPDAVNLWIGNEKSVSSMHKDHYENLYCVSSGEKIFTICPPCDALFLRNITVPSANFNYDKESNSWIIQKHNEPNSHVIWMESDVERLMDLSGQERDEYLKKHPLLEHAHPLRVNIRAGDMFYIPALWYHRVTQSEETVAVNYWYDFNFQSPSWIYFNFFQQISQHK